jgi:sec-independent protein translocase protein TatA
LLEGWEWIIIGIVAVVIILWGPAKIPEFAKALGRAKGEFEKASKEFNQAATQTSTTNTARSSDDILIETARRFGVSTEGKTRAQISIELTDKIKAIGSA